MFDYSYLFLPIVMAALIHKEQKAKKRLDQLYE